MLIGELSHHAGVTTRQTRHYEREGLITPLRTDNDYRRFDEPAVSTVRRIAQLIEMGFNTAEVREVLDVIQQQPPSGRDPGSHQQRLEKIDRAIEVFTEARAALIALLYPSD